MREKIKLSGVPETMLQTVYARAKESSGRGAIHDAKAEEIVERLDYDFSLADKDTAIHLQLRCTCSNCIISHHCTQQKANGVINISNSAE